jgi:probable rRNA maturation factor
MWTTHRISIDAEVAIPGLKAKSVLIRKAIRATLEAEKVTVPCEVNILFTNDAGMTEINLEQRGIAASTDVLSFPMLELTPGDPPRDDTWADPGTGLTSLGDMVLNLDRMVEQARTYGHSDGRELCYLTVHSVLHLLGYDHLDEGPEKVRMRAREETILTGLGISREKEEAKQL